MNINLNQKTEEIYRNLEVKIKRAFKKQVNFLEKNIRHPSLHAKKYDEVSNIWQARINNDWRFYFVISDNSYIIINITKHPK